MDDCKKFAERARNIFIEHSEVTKLYSVLDSILDSNSLGKNNTSPRHGFIIGESGSGKTQALKNYGDRYPVRTEIDDNLDERDIKDVVYLEMPNPFTIGELFQTIVCELNGQKIKSRATIGELKRQAFYLLEARKVKMLIFDEANYMIGSRFATSTEAMEALKHIANSSNVSIICAGIPEIKSLVDLSFQYKRRYPVYEFRKFQSYNDEFLNYYHAMEDFLKIDPKIEVFKMGNKAPEILFTICKGLVGSITPIVQESFRLLGVFDKDFNDLSKATIRINTLLEAYENVTGEKIILNQNK